MSPANLNAFQTKHVAQHPGSGKRVCEMQLVHATKRDCQKINFQCLLANLGEQRADVGSTSSLFALSCRDKNLCGTHDQFRFPLRDLVRVHVILRAQFGKRLFALDRLQAHFRLECCRVISSGTFHFCSQCAHCAFSFKQNFHLSACPNFQHHF